jgi:hypothetical protein
VPQPELDINKIIDNDKILRVGFILIDVPLFALTIYRHFLELSKAEKVSIRVQIYAQKAARQS